MTDIKLRDVAKAIPAAGATLAASRPVMTGAEAIEYLHIPFPQTRPRS